MTIENQHRNAFASLAALFGGTLDALPESAKSESRPYMDAHFDRLYQDEQGRVVVALAHYYHQNGDAVSDPDMEIRIDYSKQTVEPLTYQDQARYQEVYDGERVNTRLQQSLSAFLCQWLKNMKDQGHQFRGAP